MKAHPLLEKLLINEDGTQIYWQGEALEIKEYKYGRNNYKQKRVCFNSQTHTVSRLVCETYNGLMPTTGMIVKRKDFNPDNGHYTNLYWNTRGGTRTKKTKRASNSKISVNDIEVILERIEKGHFLNAIAADYNTNEMSIGRIKKRYITDKKMILKDAIRNAKGNYYKRLAYAKYFGYKTINAAVSALGKAQFILQSQQLAL